MTDENSRKHPIQIGLQDSRYRSKEMKPGEVKTYGRGINKTNYDEDYTIRAETVEELFEKLKEKK